MERHELQITESPHWFSCPLLNKTFREMQMFSVLSIHCYRLRMQRNKNWNIRFRIRGFEKIGRHGLLQKMQNFGYNVFSCPNTRV